jgi:hypothetical protein
MKNLLFEHHLSPLTTGVVDTAGEPEVFNILANFNIKLKIALLGQPEAWGEMIHEKNRTLKNQVTLSLEGLKIKTMDIVLN